MLFCLSFTWFAVVAGFVVLFGEAAIICHHFSYCVKDR